MRAILARKAAAFSTLSLSSKTSVQTISAPDTVPTSVLGTDAGAGAEGGDVKRQRTVVAVSPASAPVLVHSDAGMY